MHHRLILIDIHIFTVGQIGALFPVGADALFVIAAEDGIDNNAPADGVAAGGLEINAPLRKRFIAGDKNHF